MPSSPTQPLLGPAHELRFSSHLPVESLRPLAEWMFATRGIQEVIACASRLDPGKCMFDRLLRTLEVKLECSPADLERISASGPLLLVANHPYGLLDGLLLGSVLSKRRSDFRMLANAVLSQIYTIGSYVIPVDVFGGDAQRNGRSARTAVRWMKNGGAVGAFPAGEVSALNGMPPRIEDRSWSGGPLRMAQIASAKVVPVYISGRNSAGFQLAGVAHAGLRTLLLGRELLNKRGKTIRIAVGRAITPAPACEDGEYLRRRTYILSGRAGGSAGRHTAKERACKPLAPAQSSDALHADVEALLEGALLYSAGEYSVFVARAHDLPAVLPEIGRLREGSFRAVGEGTGRPADLDTFDSSYEHLFLWHSGRREIIGAYRLGLVSAVTAGRGLRGLYTHTLFRYGADFIDGVSPGVELGRSFVRQEYQRNPHALYHLWRGIGAYIARNLQVRYLFGAVSISNDYQHASRRLMVEYFRRNHKHSLAVNARNPFRIPLTQTASGIRDVAELNAAILDLERDEKGIPVLLRQYLNLGARIVEFNVDTSFGDALDALIIVDLRHAPPRNLAKYMGQGELSSWRIFHGVEDGPNRKDQQFGTACTSPARSYCLPDRKESYPE